MSETWLDESISDCNIELSDYIIFRNDRNRHGGGVMAYVRESLPVKGRPDIEENNAKSIWLEVTTNGGTLLVGAYYRPPGAPPTGKRRIFDITTKFH